MHDRGEATFSRALIIGATGMIGAHAVRACLRHGICVRALVRPHSNRRNLNGLDIETACGDLADAPSLHDALTGCDLLIHAAAPYPTRHFGKASLLSLARQSQAKFLGVASRSLKRIVYVSSVTTIGIPAGSDGRPAPQARPARESDDQFPIRDSSPYFAVKLTMEEMALKAARDGLPVVVVNPTFCVDELDSHQTTAQLMIPLARKQIPAYTPGHLNAVATRDVGEGIVLAAHRGQVGQRYILGGENMTSREFLARCARIAGVPAPRLAIPFPVAETLSMLTEVFAYLTRTRPLFPMTGIRMMKHSQAYDLARAREELGYEPTSVDEAVQRAYDWYRAQGML